MKDDSNRTEGYMARLRVLAGDNTGGMKHLNDDNPNPKDNPSKNEPSTLLRFKRGEKRG